MANKNFRVRNGLDIGDNISITDAGTATGITTLASVSNGNITLAPNGTGDVLITADTVQIGDSSQPATLTTNGAGNLVINTNNGTNAGSITLANGVNGDITLAPNGTGNIVLTLANDGNLTNTRNYTLGSIRNSTVEANGNVWAYGNTTSPTRGINLSNAGSETTFRPGLALRGYSGGASGGRSWLVFENSRGTAASPTAVQSGDRIVEMIGQGYNGTTWTGDAFAGGNQPLTIRGAATENWTNSPNRAGMRFEVLAQPAGVDFTATSVPTIISHSPTTATYISDAWSFRTRPTAAGGTNLSLMTLGSTLSTINSNNLNFNSSTGIVYFNVTNDGNNHIAATVSQTRATNANEFALINFTTYRSADGVNFTPTQSGDNIGQFKFNGNAYTSTTPGVPGGPGAQITASATETWSSTANGSNISFNTIKQGTTTSYNVIQASTETLSLNSTTLDLNSYDGTTALIGNNITYNRVYGQWQYDTTVTPAAANTAYAFPIASGVTDFANISSVGSTSRIIPGAAGMYKLQFSVQVQNDDSSSEHIAYLWWRKNGVDIPNSMGQVGVVKATGAVNGLTIAGWDNMVSSANTTDYFELMYAVDDATHIDFPAFGTTAFGPGTASLFVTLIPIGA